MRDISSNALRKRQSGGAPLLQRKFLKKLPKVSLTISGERGDSVFCFPESKQAPWSRENTGEQRQNPAVESSQQRAVSPMDRSCRCYQQPPTSCGYRPQVRRGRRQNHPEAGSDWTSAGPEDTPFAVSDGGRLSRMERMVEQLLQRDLLLQGQSHSGSLRRPTAASYQGLPNVSPSSQGSIRGQSWADPEEGAMAEEYLCQGCQKSCRHG